MGAFDLVIRNATLVDGTGGELRDADIGIIGGNIARIGSFAGTGAEEIDARGHIVTPGFIDPHTHYDAQAVWSDRITPSSWNGVTTVLMGNCGVGFAPCRPEERATLVALMEGIEDIPEVVMTEGLPWNWRSFPEFLDVLATRRWDVDVGTQLPHAALRIHVMGERGANHEEATEADLAQMTTLAAEAIRAGAFGFSTSRAIAHKTRAGKATPCLAAPEAELRAIAEGLRAEGRGWIQLISDFKDPHEELAMLRRVAEGSGRPMTMTLLQREHRPTDWRIVLEHIEAANRDGVNITAQVMGKATCLLMGYELTLCPFIGRPSYEALWSLPFAEKIAALRDPAVRARILGEATTEQERLYLITKWQRIFLLGEKPFYEPSESDSIGARAAREGRNPEEVAYDLMLEHGGTGILMRLLSNYAGGNLDVVHDMLAAPHTLVGLGDGGAHLGLLCDASNPTLMLTYWARDRAGAKFSLPWTVRRLTSEPAAALGLADRGVIAEGKRADLNIIDYDRLAMRKPEVLYDLPAGGRRVVQRADGYTATLLAGQVVHRDGTATAALPGRLLRAGR